MSGNIFLDTNVVIYAHTDLDLLKQNNAQSIMSSQNASISTQVLQGAANILNRKFKQSWQDIVFRGHATQSAY